MELKVDVSGVKMFLVKREVGRIVMLPVAFSFDFFSHLCL